MNGWTSNDGEHRVVREEGEEGDDDDEGDVVEVEDDDDKLRETRIKGRGRDKRRGDTD